jgi:outer membrane protein assembly factor BamB
LEFDGKASNQSAAICAENECINSASVNQGSRFDPSIDGVDRDAVQYVFWGSNNDLINAPCRVNRFLTPNTNKTYDDNRHDTVSEVWRYSSGSRSLSSPAVDDSDTLNIKIYTGQSCENISGTCNDRGRLIRLNPSDGTAVWSENPDGLPDNDDDDIDSSPALDTDINPATDARDIFIGNDAFYISRYNSNGTSRWTTRLENDDNIEGKPAVSSDAKNRVYVVGDTGTLYSINKSTGARQWAFDIFVGSTSEDFTSSPVVIEGSGSNPNVIYVGSLDNALYAVRDNGGTASQIFRYTRATGPIRSTPAINPVSGDIYFGSDDNRVYAVTNGGADRWLFPTGGDVVSSPAVSSDGSRLYVGSDDNHLYALNTQNGNQIWRYRTNGNVRSSPTVATDGVVYFGSDDGHLYAVNPDGSLRWQYPPPGASALDRIRCKPAIGPNGIVYFTTEDAPEGRLFAVEPAFNDPPNIPNLYLTPEQLDPAAAGSYSNNWLTLSDAPNGWAVRLEVERSLSPNASGNYEYTLKTWMKKCEDEACSNVTGRFFQNTRFQYDWAGETIPISPMTQTIELSNTSTPPPGQLDFLHDRFDRFLFGFTSASTAPQTIEIRKFQLSFIRPNDPLAND